MGKEKLAEKRVAKNYFMHELMNAKEISERLCVSEKTVGEWIKRGGWKEQRDAFINSSKQQIQQIKEVLSSVAERRLQIVKEINSLDPNTDSDSIKSLREEALKLADEASKWNKTMQSIDKSNSTTLETYLKVMEEIFSDLRESDPKLYLKTLDFQENHIQKVSLKFQ